MSGPVEWRCVAADLAPGHTAKFQLECGTRRVNGFIVNHDGAFRAFVNRCPHVGTPLDLWENEFLAGDGRTIVCATHGAVFEPADGRCVAGPCAGDALTALPLRRDGAHLVVWSWEGPEMAPQSCLELGGPRNGPPNPPA